MDSRERAIAEPGFAEQWPAVLDRLQGPLCEVVGDLDASGAPATVVYWAPSSVVGVFSCPAKAGESAAEEAARLALVEASGLPLAERPWALRSLATDATATGQRHTLGVAERDAVAAALHTWVARAGLMPEGSVPGAAVGLLVAADEALSRDPSAPCIVAHIGEQGSAIVAAAGGSLRLSRQLPIGLDALVDAITREIRGETPVTLARPEAQSLLASAGIPMREQLLGTTGLRGAALLPLLQPILQRCVVEIRQSVRFGLDEPDRARATLVCMGPGAVTPRLPEVLAEQCGLTLAAPGGPDDLLAALGAHPPIIQPRAIREASQGRRLTRVLAAGFAGAALLVAMDGVLTRTHLSSLNREIDRLRNRKHELEPVLATRRATLSAGRGVTAARAQIASTLGQVAAWDGVLALLAQKTPESIRLGALSLSIESDRVLCRIDGQVRGASDPAAAVTAYLDALSASPLVQECRVGTTQRAEGGAAVSFNMSLTITGLPSLAEASP